MWSFDLFFHPGHISLSQCTCYIVRGRALGVHLGTATHSNCLWGRGQRGNIAACWALALLSRDWQFLLPPQLPQDFTARGSEAFFFLPTWIPVLWVLSLSPVVPPSLSPHECETAWSASFHVAMWSLNPGYLSLPLLPFWINVSSLTPWLSDFHTVWFCGSSGGFLFLNWLFPSFEQEGEVYLPTPSFWWEVLGSSFLV